MFGLRFVIEHFPCGLFLGRKLVSFCGGRDKYVLYYVMYVFLLYGNISSRAAAASRDDVCVFMFGGVEECVFCVFVLSIGLD